MTAKAKGSRVKRVIPIIAVVVGWSLILYPFRWFIYKKICQIGKKPGASITRDGRMRIVTDAGHHHTSSARVYLLSDGVLECDEHNVLVEFDVADFQAVSEGSTEILCYTGFWEDKNAPEFALYHVKVNDELKISYTEEELTRKEFEALEETALSGERRKV